MKALYIYYPGKVELRDVQLTNSGTLPKYVFLRFANRSAQRDAFKEGTLEVPALFFEIKLAGHEVEQNVLGLRSAYWPEIWEEHWGRHEVGIFLANEIKRRKAK